VDDLAHPRQVVMAPGSNLDSVQLGVYREEAVIEDSRSLPYAVFV
jgi:hypothetical protein